MGGGRGSEEHEERGEGSYERHYFYYRKTDRKFSSFELSHLMLTCPGEGCLETG